MYFDIIQGVEMSSIEMIKQDSDVVWWMGIYENQVSRPMTSTFIRQEDLPFIQSSTAIRHLDTLWKINLRE